MKIKPYRSPPDMNDRATDSEFQFQSPAKSSHLIARSPPARPSKKQRSLAPASSAKISAEVLFFCHSDYLICYM